VNRCIVGAGKCRSTETENDGTRVPGPVEDVNSQLCNPCLELLDRIVANLMDDWDALTTLLGERQTVQAAKVSYTQTPSIPIAVDPEALMVELVDIAETASAMTSRVLCKDQPNPYRGIHHAHPRTEQASLQASVDLLTGNLDALLRSEKQEVARWSPNPDAPPAEWKKIGTGKYIPVDSEGRQIIVDQGRVLDEMSGVDVALEIWRLHDRVRAHFGTRIQDRRDQMPTACPMCSMRTLYRYHGESIVKCTNCRDGKGRKGWIYPDEYNQLEGYVVWMHKRQEENDIETLKWLVAERDYVLSVESWIAAERWHQLERLARFAGHDTVDQLLSVLDAA
jgi:hypothetical protein